MSVTGSPPAAELTAKEILIRDASLVRGVGLRAAGAINAISMIGIGPRES